MKESESVKRAQRNHRVDSFIAKKAKETGKTHVADQANARLRESRRTLSKYN